MPIQLVDIGTIPDDGTGDPLRNAYDALNDNDLLLAGGFQTITPFTAGVTPVVPNSNYFATLNGPVTFPALPAASDGDWISFYLNVAVPSAVNLHTNNTVYRIGGSGPLAAPINFPVGNHRLTLRLAGLRWWVEASELSAAQAADLAALHAKDAQHDAAIAALQAKDISLDSDIENLVNKDALLDADIDALQATDVDLQTQLNGHSDQIAAIQVVNNDQDAKDAAQDGQIAALQNKDIEQGTTIALVAGGLQVFTNFTPNVSPISLNTNYQFQTAISSWTLPAIPVALDGHSVTFHFKNTAPLSVNLNANNPGAVFRISKSGVAVSAPINFAIGVHRITLRRSGGIWYMDDSQMDADKDAYILGLLGGDQEMTPFTIGTTQISVNKNYQLTLAVPWTFPILPSAPDGDAISFWMDVTAQSDVNLHTNNEIYRIGHAGAGQLATPLTFTVGKHLLELRKISGRWWFQDSIPFQAAAPPPVDLDPLYAKDAEHDAAITALQAKDTTHDTAITNLQAKDSVQDGAINSLGTMDIKLAGGFQTLSSFTPGSTPVAVNKNFVISGSMAFDYAIGTLPVAQDGDWISFIFSSIQPLRFDVHTGGNTVYRISQPNTPVSAGILFPTGTHQIMLRKAGTRWIMWDNQLDTEQSALILKLSGGWLQSTAFTPGVTTIQVDTWYEGTLDGTQWTFPILPSAPDGSAISWHLNVTAPTVVNLHTNNEVYRIGTSGQLAATITFPIGKHNLRLRKVLSRWWFDDSILVGGQAGAIALIEADIDALQAKDVTHDNQIAALVAKDVSLDADIDALEYNDLALQAAIDNNTAGINNLSLAHNNQQSEIDAVEVVNEQQDAAIAALEAGSLTQAQADLRYVITNSAGSLASLAVNGNVTLTGAGTVGIGAGAANQVTGFVPDNGSFSWRKSGALAGTEVMKLAVANSALTVGAVGIYGGTRFLSFSTGPGSIWMYDGGSNLRSGMRTTGTSNNVLQSMVPTAGAFSWNKGGDFQNDGENQLMRLNATTGELSVPGSITSPTITKLAGGYQDITPYTEGDALVANRNYFGVITSANWVLPALPNVEGTNVTFYLLSPTPFTLSLASNPDRVRRLGVAGTAALTSVNFPAGFHLLKFRQCGTTIFLEDSAMDVQHSADIAALAGGWRQYTAFMGIPAVNQNYYSPLTGPWTIGPLPGAEGDWISFIFDVTAPAGIDFAGNTAYRIGKAGALTILDLPVGIHQVTMRRTNNAWYVEDSADDSAMQAADITALQATDSTHTNQIATLQAQDTLLLGGKQYIEPFTIGVSVIQINHNYFTLISSDWAVDGFPSLEGDQITFWLSCGGPVNIDFHTNGGEVYLMGSPDPVAAAIPFSYGYHKFTITRAGGITIIEVDQATALTSLALKAYANDNAADADATLLSGQLYKVGRRVFQKP